MRWSMDSTTRHRHQNNHQHRHKSYHDDGAHNDRRSLLFGTILALVVAPITFRITKLIEQDTFKADILASILTVILTVLFSVLLNNLYHQRQNDPSRHRSKQNRGDKENIINLNDTSYSWRLFSGICSYIYGQPSSPSSGASLRSKSRNKQNLNDRSHSDDGTDQRRQSKIDPKYFKPKFIIHELMTFWDTTCTVITWGSFYVIGGTIVATEKLAQKIKTKRTRDSNNNLKDSAHNSSTSFGRFDSFTSSFTGSSSPSSSSSRQQQQTSAKQASSSTGADHPRRPLGRISSRTKRSFSSAKKKITKVTTGTGGIGTMPQIEESQGGGGLLNSSFLSGNFRST